jgi:uncharacterized protein YceK
MRNFTVVLFVLLAGCAHIETDQTDTTITDVAGVKTRTIKTRATGYTFMAGKQHLDKLRTTNTDKTQGMSVGSVEQESDASPLAKAISEGATTAALKFAKP